jgi:hypothetical protein
MVQIHAHIYVNGKMRPIEIMPGGVADKGEWMRRWIQVWHIWYIVRTFVNSTMYPKHNNTKGKNNTGFQCKINEVSYIGPWNSGSIQQVFNLHLSFYVFQIRMENSSVMGYLGGGEYSLLFPFLHR